MHDDELALRVDSLDLPGNEQPAPAVDRADSESGRLARRPEPRLLDPAKQPLSRLEAKSVAAKEAVRDDDCHVVSIPDSSGWNPKLRRGRVAFRQRATAPPSSRGGKNACRGRQA